MTWLAIERVYVTGKKKITDIQIFVKWFISETLTTKKDSAFMSKSMW